MRVDDNCEKKRGGKSLPLFFFPPRLPARAARARISVRKRKRNLF